MQIICCQDFSYYRIREEYFFPYFEDVLLYWRKLDIKNPTIKFPKCNRKKKRKLSTILLSILWISKYGKKVEASTLNLNPIRNKEKKAGGTSKILNFKSIDEFKSFNLIFLL